MKQKVILLSILIAAFYSIITSTVFKNASLPAQTSFYWDKDDSYTVDTILSQDFTDIGKEFTFKKATGSIWILMKFKAIPNNDAESYALDLGQDSVSTADLYARKGGFWNYLGRTGKKQDRKITQTSIMRDVFVINGKNFENEQFHFLLLKIVPNYGGTIIFTLCPTNKYWKNVIKVTIAHSTVSCICFSLAFMMLIYGILLSNALMILASANSFIFMLLQLQLTGIGSSYIWNFITRNISSNNYISYFLMRLLIISISLIFLSLLKYKKKFKYKTWCKATIYAVISISIIDFLINCFVTSPKFIFFSFNVCIIIQNFVFQILTVIMNMKNRKEMPYNILNWIPVFAFNNVKHICSILLIISNASFYFFNKDVYLFKYLSFLIFILPFLQASVKNIRTKFKDLHTKIESLEKKHITNEIDNKFYITTIHQLIDMNTMAINALNMPDLSFNTYGSKEIKNLIHYYLVKSQSFLNTTLKMRTKQDMYESNILLQSFFSNCLMHIETMAKRNLIKINVQSSIEEDTYVCTNPYILQLIFASLASSVIKLTVSDSIVSITLNYADDMLTYTLQNEIASEEHKTLKKILSKYNSDKSDYTEETDTYEFEMIHRVCKLYNGNLCVKSLPKGFLFTAQVKVKHLDMIKNSDIICTKSFYNPDLNKDKKPIPIKLPFSYFKDTPLSIFIAEDNLVNISYFKNILQEYGIVKTASTGLEAWNTLNENLLLPDIIVAEYSLPMISGTELFKKCKGAEALQNIPFIMLLHSSEYDRIQELYAAGVSSCLVKPFSTIDFFNQISSVISTTYKAKNSVLNQLNKAVISNYNIAIEKPSSDSKQSDAKTSQLEKANLSPREKEIALLISVGRSDKEIAQELNISPATVATHNKNIFKKLSVHSRIELIKKVQ